MVDFEAPGALGRLEEASGGLRRPKTQLAPHGFNFDEILHLVIVMGD